LATLPFEILITLRSVSLNLKSFRYRMASTVKRSTLTQAANQSRSHPSMSVTWILVS